MGNATPDLDRLLAADYVEGLDDLPMEDLRARKVSCEQVEGELSYLRRLVQGRLDIITAELRRREGGENGGLAELVDHLPEILAEGGRGATSGRRPTEMASDVNHRLITAELDRIIDVDRVATLPTMGTGDVAAIAAALVDLEHRISSQRRALHECLDTVQAEIIRRYKSGEATVDSLLPPES
ncbi:MAG TPA: hypothetical protein VMZ51_07405 [Acidimicrobiales bacterium]|nr:hypothetical protein [Acidimicrobiales bacterium]